MASASSYRGRLAPSPTGLLHLGHARTFVTAAARARAAAGVLILRSEDIDPQRARPEFARAMVEDLRWLGLAWQEGPDVSGPFAPYIQSRREELYLAAWRRLAAEGCVYPCVCTRGELRAQTAAQPGEPDDEDEPHYSGRCRPLAPVETTELPASPHGVNWRFRVPDGERVCFYDQACDECCYVAGRDFGDFLIWRREGVAAYQLACVVDDAAMRITEVVRGADLLKSTARQLLLYRALGLQPPTWYHGSLVRDAEGRRLAKRAGALSIRALREQGWSPAEVLARAAADSSAGPAATLG